MASWGVRFFTFPLSFLQDCLLQHRVPALVSNTNMARASVPNICCSLSPRVAKTSLCLFFCNIFQHSLLLHFNLIFNFISNWNPYWFSEVSKNNWKPKFPCAFLSFSVLLFLFPTFLFLSTFWLFQKLLVLVVQELFILLTVSVLSVSSGWRGGGCWGAVCCRAASLRRGQGLPWFQQLPASSSKHMQGAAEPLSWAGGTSVHTCLRKAEKCQNQVEEKEGDAAEAAPQSGRKEGEEVPQEPELMLFKDFKVLEEEHIKGSLCCSNPRRTMLEQILWRVSHWDR